METSVFFNPCVPVISGGADKGVLFGVTLFFHLFIYSGVGEGKSLSFFFSLKELVRSHNLQASDTPGCIMFNGKALEEKGEAKYPQSNFVMFYPCL